MKTIITFVLFLTCYVASPFAQTGSEHALEYLKTLKLNGITIKINKDGSVYDVPKFNLLLVKDNLEWIDVDILYTPKKYERSIISCFLVNDAGLVQPSVSAFHLDIYSRENVWSQDVVHNSPYTFKNINAKTMPHHRYELSFPNDVMKDFHLQSTLYFRIPRRLLKGSEPNTQETERKIVISFSEVRWYMNGHLNTGRKFVSEPIILVKENDRWNKSPAQKIEVGLKCVEAGVVRTNEVTSKVNRVECASSQTDHCQANVSVRSSNFDDSNATPFPPLRTK
jgi:hypothetical protein